MPSISQTHTRKEARKQRHRHTNKHTQTYDSYIICVGEWFEAAADYWLETFDLEYKQGPQQ